MQKECTSSSSLSDRDSRLPARCASARYSCGIVSNDHFLIDGISRFSLVTLLFNGKMAAIISRPDLFGEFARIDDCCYAKMLSSLHFCVFSQNYSEILNNREPNKNQKMTKSVRTGEEPKKKAEKVYRLQRSQANAGQNTKWKWQVLSFSFFVWYFAFCLSERFNWSEKAENFYQK